MALIGATDSGFWQKKKVVAFSQKKNFKIRGSCLLQ